MNKRNTIIRACYTMLIGMVAITVNAQNFEWAKSFEGSSWSEPWSITVDTSGNVFTVGYFEETVDFDPGAGTYNLTSTGADDIFVQKLDASGNFLWARSFGSEFNDIAYSVSTDAAGNVHIAGSFQGTVDFDPGTGVEEITTEASDVFILKLDPSGDFIWVRSFGGTFARITVDAESNVYTTGYFSGTSDFDTGGGTTNITADGFFDIFVHKLDASGNYIWVRTLGGSGDDRGIAIASDTFGNVHITGRYNETVDFDPGPGTTSYTSLGFDDIFVMKMAPSGDFIWAQSFGGPVTELTFSIKCDDSGNVYTTGRFGETLDFGTGTASDNLTSAGSDDIFVYKMDDSGNYVWAQSIGNTGVDQGRSISIDASNNVYVTGDFTGTVDFDPGVGTANLTSLGTSNAFVHKMDAAGNFVWAQSIGGDPFNYGSAIATDALQNVYTSGYFRGTTDFDPGEGTFNLTATGLSDVFVQKLNQNPTGIIELGNGIQVAAYPNPSAGFINISFAEPLVDVVLTITDLHGKVLYTKSFDRVFNEQIEVADAAAGILFLSIQTPEGQRVIKLIKE